MDSNGITYELPALVFVYGTLKQGFGNHSLLFDSELVGNAKTNKPYPLHVPNLPFLLDDPGVGFKVSGEVYRVVRPTVMASLDRLEGHPDFYRRTKIEVILEGQDEPVEVWAYAIPKKRIKPMFGPVEYLDLKEMYAGRP